MRMVTPRVLARPGAAARRGAQGRGTSLTSICSRLAASPSVVTGASPASTVSSLCSLYAYTRALFSDDVDPLALGPELMGSYLPDSLDKALAQVDALPAGRVAHVRAPELFTDPVRTMESAYRDLGMELSTDARLGMQTLLEAARPSCCRSTRTHPFPK